MKEKKELLREKGYIESTLFSIPEIYTFLIQQTGRHVEHYASDLLYDLKTIEEALHSEKHEDSEHLIGLRVMGVDGTEYVKIKTGDPVVYGHPYICIYKVAIQFNEKEGTIEAILTEMEQEA